MRYSAKFFEKLSAEHNERITSLERIGDEYVIKVKDTDLDLLLFVEAFKNFQEALAVYRFLARTYYRIDFKY